MRGGNLDPMYFLDSANMGVPVVAKQSEVGISYSGSVQFSSASEHPECGSPILTLGGNIPCQ